MMQRLHSGFGVGMSRSGSALEPPWSQKMRAKVCFYVIMCCLG